MREPEHQIPQQAVVEKQGVMPELLVVVEVPEQVAVKPVEPPLSWHLLVWLVPQVEVWATELISEYDASHTLDTITTKKSPSLIPYSFSVLLSSSRTLP